ncbi:MAG: chitobiase/beta-hexosaminidase C-terminal domain-containing protein [Verrucomicrobiae bacterium]|nr:chitobiase/beta-hexosaminidase C-terminal domain-containing protein [Verrucomicrobiae bacterium]
MKILFKQFLARGRILAQVAWCGIFIACGSGAFSQTVTTIAGGRLTPQGPDYGFRDGNSQQEAQFNFPAALAIGFDGRLYVADKNNKAIRRLDLSANQTITIITNLNVPVGILFDNHGDMYVLTQGDGKIHQFDTNYNYLGVVNTNGNFVLPTAFCMDGTKNFYVTESGGALKRVNATNGAPYLITNGFNNPQGVAILDNGLIAVSDTGNHAIKLVNQFSSFVTVLAGGNGQGFSNGVPAVVKFSSPHGIVKAPNGALIVADRFNHRVRLVQTNGYTTTIYGIDPSLWEYCPTCEPPVYEGWSDGVVSNTALDPAAREPVAVAVSSDGRRVYSAEVYYHIIREVSGINLSDGGTGGATNVVNVPAPSIVPDSGYYPNGIKITVNSTVADVFYTTDGSEPTTNSARVVISGNTGTIYWSESMKDLTYLKVRAFIGTNWSATVSGKTSQSNLIGIPRDVKAGQGSTILVPIVATLRSGERLRSIQFLAQVTPDGSAPVISDQFRLLNISTNDFISVVAPAMNPQQPVVMSYTSLLLNSSRTLVVTAIGTNANFEVSSYAVVGMLVVPIPPNASVGDTYTIQISTASGTSDGLPTSTNNVNLTLMAPRKIIVTNVAYTVGDTAGAGWYAAGEFGDGKLLNNDVLNAFYASLGIKVPPTFTDLFDAMDAFPDDEPGIPGGDGDIRYLDWQRILYRSLGLYTNTVAGTNWTRSWSAGGIRTNNVAVVGIASSLLAQHGQAPSGEWRKDGRVGALSVNNAVPGSYVSVPIYAQAAQGCAFYGMQFRAVIIPSENAPLLSAAPEFVSAITARPFVQTFGNDQLVLAWGGYGIGELFATPLTGSNLLGYVRFLIPANAKSGDCYVLRFKRADSGYGNRQFELETFPAQVAVLSQANPTISLISDEWRTNFFGAIENKWSEPEADPDGDNVPNWLEFQRGANPVELRFRVNSDIRNSRVIRLKWFGRNNMKYAVETADRLSPEAWQDLKTVSGADDLLEIEDVIQTGTRFYRIIVK